MKKTGNDLFDIFWKEYPARINGAGAMEKKRKKDALRWFERHNPPEETVYDMVKWIKADNANREMPGFYPSVPDAIVFLNQEKWIYDEIGTVPTKTQRFEKKRSVSVTNNNVKALISQYSSVITEWGIDRLKADKGFMHASRAYPEFAKWAIEKKPDLKKPTPDADLPPPEKNFPPNRVY